jgi:hypothetical protein
VANLNQEQLRRMARDWARWRGSSSFVRKKQRFACEFPELFGRGRQAQSHDGQVTSGRRRRRRTMSAAGRRAVSVRMRKYWAERRKAKGGK